MTPTALLLLPAVIAGPSDDGTFNNKLNLNVPSVILSFITGTLTLADLIPLANVAVSTDVSKSMLAVSQTC